MAQLWRGDSRHGDEDSPMGMCQTDWAMTPLFDRAWALPTQMAQRWGQAFEG